jgi:hypothetical protein
MIKSASVYRWREVAIAASAVETRVGSRASDCEAEYTWSSGRYVMRAVVLHEYGGPEKLKFEDNVPERRLAEVRY